MYLTCLNFSQWALDCSPTVNISKKYTTSCWPMHYFRLLLQKIRRANLRVSCLMAGSSNNSLPCSKIWFILVLCFPSTYFSIITSTYVLSEHQLTLHFLLLCYFISPHKRERIRTRYKGGAAWYQKIKIKIWTDIIGYSPICTPHSFDTLYPPPFTIIL